MSEWKPMVMVGTYRYSKQCIRGYIPSSGYWTSKINPTLNTLFLSTFDRNIEQCLTMLDHLEQHLSK